MASTIVRLLSLATRRAVGAPTRRYGSALFIPGNKATENFAFLSPYLDFDERFADLEKLRRELRLRGAEVDTDKLAQSWELYKRVDADRWALERRKLEIAEGMKQLKKKVNPSAEEQSERLQLMAQGKLLKQDLRIIKETLWDMEETVVVQALRLPNETHEKTPIDSAVVLRSVGEKREPPVDRRRSHLEIGRDLGLIDYANPIHCYLNDDAALFELGAIGHAGDVLADARMFRVAGTDFARSLVVEAAGLDHEDPQATFVLENNEGVDPATCNRLHLLGGASLASFLAMHTKQLVNPKDFPLRYFATGRQYSPFPEGAKPDGLFNCCQSSAAQVFVAVKDPQSDEYDQQFDDLLGIVSRIYDELGVHYRVVVRSVGELRNWESLRVSYEMWSANSQRYVEVGHVSLCGRYFSKRLLIAYQTPTGREFPAIITGTAISVPRLLGCLLEEDPTEFRIPARISANTFGTE